MPITGPMSRILARLNVELGDDYLIRAGNEPLALGATTWTQMIQRIVSRAKIDEHLRAGAARANWYSIRRRFADWLDERVSDAAISAVMGHFEISARNRPNSSKQAAR